MKPRNNKQENDSFYLLLSKEIVTFNVHKNFFEQLKKNKAPV